jgi:MFS family permease
MMLTAFLIDQIGSWAYNVVLIVYVYDRTGSATWIAATTAAGWVPRILFSAYAGVLADRFERTRTLLVSALLALVLMAAIAFVVATGGPIPLLLVLAAATATVGTVYQPASGALIPETVGESHLGAANGLFGMLENIVVVAGPAIGGLLLLTGRPVWGILVNLASFAVAAVLISRLKVRSTGTADSDGERLLGQAAAGCKALRRSPQACTLVAFCALGTAVYGTGADGYSYLLTGAAIGGVLGAAIAGKLGHTQRLAPVVCGGLLAEALPFAATIMTTSPVFGFVLQVVSGGGMVVVDVLAITALQRNMPRDLLSRAIGLLQTAALGASFAVAALIHELGLTDALLIVGFGFSAIAAAGLRPLSRTEHSTPGAAAIPEPPVTMRQDPVPTAPAAS